MMHIRAVKLLVMLRTQHDPIAVVQAKIRAVPHAVQMVTARILSRSADDAGAIPTTHAFGPSGFDLFQELSTANSIFECEVMPEHGVVCASVGQAHLLSSLDSIAATGQQTALPTGSANRLGPDADDSATITGGSHQCALAAISGVHGASKTSDRQPADVLADVPTIGALTLTAWLTKSVLNACNCRVWCRTFGATLRAYCSHYRVRLWRQCSQRNSDELSIGRPSAKNSGVIIDGFARSKDYDAGLFDQNVAHQTPLMAAQRLRFYRDCSTRVLRWVNTDVTASCAQLNEVRHGSF